MTRALLWACVCGIAACGSGDAKIAAQRDAAAGADASTVSDDVAMDRRATSDVTVSPSDAATERRPDGPQDAGRPPGDATLGSPDAGEGRLVFQDDFSSGIIRPVWTPNIGTWMIVNGVLQGAEDPADMHHASCGREMPLQRVILDFSFQFDTTSQIGIGINHHGPDTHLAHIAFLATGSLSLSKQTGWGPTTTNTRVDTGRFTFVRGQWYRGRVRLYDRHVMVWINDMLVLEADIDDPAATPRNHFVFNAYDGIALYDNVKIWEALP